MAQGHAEPSFLSQLIEAGDAEGEERFTNKLSAMSLYTAGADTVSCPPTPPILEMLTSLTRLSLP